MAHPLETILKSNMEELRQLTDVDTVVGEAVHVGENTVILPVSRVTLGFVSGGGEYGTKNPVLRSGLALDGAAYPFAGTLAAGVGVSPVAFLAVTDGQVSVLPAQECAPYGLLSLLPDLVREVQGILQTVKQSQPKEQGNACAES